jgi:predicted O-methyltransferase YrrM
MNTDYRIALLAATAIMVPGSILAALGAPAAAAVIVTIGCATAAILTLNRRWYRQIIARLDSQTTHLRSAIGHAATAGGLPIFWSEHAITPETLAVVQHLSSSLKLRRVLELGSGVSTLLLANGFRRAGEGHVLSLDDDARWAEQSAATIRREQLDGFAEVRVAPLVPVSAGGRQSQWYDISSLDADSRFDLIIVDGPPAWRGDTLARLPALYQLRRHLSDDGVMVLDDAGRGGETEVAKRWQQDFPELHYRMVGVGRGLFVASVRPSSLDLLPS